MTKSDSTLHEHARAIGTTMRHDIAHALDRRALNVSARARGERNSADAAHGSDLEIS
jgi:hypothetical protein